MDIEYVRSRFIKHFDGTTGAVYASPGRINLIGEHTDYNGGFVFPGAIDKGMIAEIKPNGTNTVKAYSIDLKLVLSSVYRCVALRKRKYQPMQMVWHVPIGLNPNLRVQQLLK